MTLTRITEGMVSRRLLGDLQRANAQMAATQAQISSGNRIQRPSDDPSATRTSLRLRSELEQIRQHQRNADDAQGWLTVTDQALGTIGDAIHRARELVVQAGNDSIGPEGRQAVALEIDRLIGAVKLAANARFGASYVFAGQNTTQAPYNPDSDPANAPASDAYTGDGGPIGRTIGPGVSVDLNVIGMSVLGDGTTGLLSDLRQMAANMRAGDGAQLRSTDLQKLEGHLAGVLAQRTTVGALTTRLQAASSRLADTQLATERLLGKVEDTDYAEALTRLSSQQSVYQAALRSGAQIIQPSLLDFLR